MNWFDEALHEGISHKGYIQRLSIERVLYHGNTGLQDLIIFENPFFGKVLALDGVIQTTEADEYCYHEMLAHPFILAHGAVNDVLIIGGGDGGALREVLRHRSVKRAVMVEIDRSVIDLCRTHMPTLSDGAFDDPRCELIVADGLRFVEKTDRRFDIIIVDSTDPTGPGEALFTRTFYSNCQRCLAEGGALVTQNGVPFFQGKEVADAYRRMKHVFANSGFYVTAVPSYAGGFMTLGWGAGGWGAGGWGAGDANLGHVPEDVIAGRFARAGLETKYYSPEVHTAAFKLPAFIRKLMKD